MAVLYLLRKRRLLRLTAGVAVLVVLIHLLGFGFFTWKSVCGGCGASRYSTELFYVLPVHLTRQTSLSNYAQKAGLVSAEHRHDWLFGSGSGAGTMCAIGTGRYLYRNIRSEKLVTFLGAVDRYQGKQEAGRWLAKALDVEQRSDIVYWLPEDPAVFQDAHRFNVWFEEIQEMEEELELNERQ